MDISPKTDREKLIAEAVWAQGFEEGVRVVTERLKQRALAALRVEAAGNKNG
jgi:hypothetical protein